MASSGLFMRSRLCGRGLPGCCQVRPRGTALGAPAEDGEVPDICLEAVLIIERGSERAHHGRVHLDDPPALAADQVNVSGLGGKLVPGSPVPRWDIKLNPSEAAAKIGEPALWGAPKIE